MQQTVELTKETKQPDSRAERAFICLLPRVHLVGDSSLEAIVSGVKSFSAQRISAILSAVTTNIGGEARTGSERLYCRYAAPQELLSLIDLKSFTIHDPNTRPPIPPSSAVRDEYNKDLDDVWWFRDWSSFIIEDTCSAY